MASLNKVLLIGHLGADPELGYTASGRAKASFRIATSERFTHRETGERTERTEWHRIVVWGGAAEACAEYLAKGRAVFVEGRLTTRQWETKDGEPRWTTEIVADRVEFLSRGSSGTTETAPETEGEGDSDVDHEEG